MNWITTPDSVKFFWGLMISVPAFFSLNVSLLFNIFHVLHLFCCSFFTVNQCSKYRTKNRGKIGQRLNVKKPSCDQARALSTCIKPVQNLNEHTAKLLGGCKKCGLFYSRNKLIRKKPLLQSRTMGK